MTTNATTPEIPLPGSTLADGGVEGGPPPPTTETNYPYGFGYAYGAVKNAVARLESHQYKAAIEDLQRDLAFLNRMRTGWNPEVEK